jgi:hypothetical protein
MALRERAGIKTKSYNHCIEDHSDDKGFSNSYHYNNENTTVMIPFVES